jgi:hypothetical protein
MGMPAQWQAPDGEGPDRTLELYKVAVDEYRFQAHFNWSRTQYLLAFCAAILAAGVGVAGQGRGAALVFALGAVVAGMSVQVTRVQHGYYAKARDHLRRLEERLELDRDARLDTTATLGERKKPRVNVTGVINLLFVALVVAHLVGVAVVLVANG